MVKKKTLFFCKTVDSFLKQIIQFTNIIDVARFSTMILRSINFNFYRSLER